MKYLTYLIILLGVVKTAFRGGGSQCELLHSNFLALLQACELSHERVVNRTIWFFQKFLTFDLAPPLTPCYATEINRK